MNEIKAKVFDRMIEEMREEERQGKVMFRAFVSIILVLLIVYYYSL